MSRIDEIEKLTEQISEAEARTPRDEVEMQRLKKLRSDFAVAELASRKDNEKVTSSVHPPLYPEGLRARLAQYEAEVIQAWFDVGTWHYLIDVKPVPVVGVYRANLTEAEAKTEVAERTGQAPGPAYPRGATFNRHGQGGEILDVLLSDGVYYYRLLGRDDVMSETELRDLLNAA